MEGLPNTANEAEAREELSKNGNGAAIPTALDGDGTKTDWSRSYFGLSAEPFSKEISEVLQAPIDPLDIEIKPGNCLHCFRILLLITN